MLFFLFPSHDIEPIQRSELTGKDGGAIIVKEDKEKIEKALD